MDIKVLGPGCANCVATLGLIERVAREKGLAPRLTKVEDIRDILSYGILSTPGVVIDGAVVHWGGVPTRGLVEQWLSTAVGGLPDGKRTKAAIPVVADWKAKCCG